MDSFQITILILQYNGFELTKRLFLSMDNFGEMDKFEIILADNNSTESDGFDYFRQKYPKVKLVKHSINYGFAKGINRLLPYVSTPYLMLLNNDIIFENAAITETFKCLQVYQASAATCMMFEENGKMMHNSSYAISPINRLTHNATGISSFRRLLFQRVFPKPHKVAYINGGFLVLSKDLFTKVDGFNERYFMYTEDLDLMLKFRKEKAKLLFCPGGKVIHADGSSTKKIWNSFKKEEIQTIQVIDCYRRHFKAFPFFISQCILFTRIIKISLLRKDLKYLELTRHLFKKII